MTTSSSTAASSSSAPATSAGLATASEFQPDSVPEIVQIMELVNLSLRELPDKVTQMQASLSAGMTRVQLAPPDTALLEQTYTAAYELYQRQRYREALPLALFLAISNFSDIRFLFMAGMILQLLGDALMGAILHACALQVDPDFVPAAYRLAECYTALGENDDARSLFDEALDMGRDSEEFFALQRAIMQRLGQLN